MHGTLEKAKQRPLRANIDLSGASLLHVVASYNRFRDELEAEEGAVSKKPESEALWFYMQQHAMSLIERDVGHRSPLGAYAPFVACYHNTMNWKALRMFYYLLLICTRESRHASGTSGKDKVYKMHPNIAPFHKNHVKDSSAHSAIIAILSNAPDVTLGEYTQFLVRMFTYPSYSHGFGGKAWRAIAVPLNDFVHGKISAEILLDTSFTLAHNNGPIFNKGMLYDNYNSVAIRKVLDVQRSGQIPQLIKYASSFDLEEFVSEAMIQYVDDFSKLNRGFTGKVDWSRVKDIHGHVAWSQYVSKSTTSSKVDYAAKFEKQKQVLAAKQAELAKKKLLANSIEIMPGQLVPFGPRSEVEV